MGLGSWLERRRAVGQIGFLLEIVEVGDFGCGQDSVVDSKFVY